MARGRGIRKRGDTWTFTVDVGRDPVTGKRRQRSRGGFRTQRACEAARTALLAEVQSGQYHTPAKQTVAEYLEQWRAAQTVRDLTREEYGRKIRHLASRLGTRPLAALTPLDIQGYVAWALREGRRDGGPLAPITVRLRLALLSQALAQAVKWGLLTRNPCDAVDPPRGEPAERPVLSRAQARQLLGAVEGTWLQVPVLLAIACGLRRGEVLGLRWEDVDTKGGVLHVRQQLLQVGGEVRFGPPKSRSSAAPVRLPELLLAPLAAQRAQQARDREALREVWQDSGLVVCEPDGSPIKGDRLGHAWRKLRAELGLPEVHFHDLRHSHASHLLGEGTPTHVVSARLRHASPIVTMRVYAHLLPGQAEAAAALTDRLLGEAEEGENGDL